MKRNLMLVRAILEAVEVTPAYHKPSFDDLLGLRAEIGRETKRYSRTDIDTHLVLLIEGGLLTGCAQTIRVERLTWAGHDYLDALRNPPPRPGSAKSITDAFVRQLDSAKHATGGINSTRADGLERL
jgi:hypothetical protein